MIGLTNSQWYRDIARAIRSKLGGSTTYKPREMAAAIRGIESSGDLIFYCPETWDYDGGFYLHDNIFNADTDVEIGFKVVSYATRTEDYLISISMNNSYLKLWLSNGSGSNGWFGAQYGSTVLFSSDLVNNDIVKLIWHHDTKHLTYYVNNTQIADVDFTSFYDANSYTLISGATGDNGVLSNFYIRRI